MAELHFCAGEKGCDSIQAMQVDLAEICANGGGKVVFFPPVPSTTVMRHVQLTVVYSRKSRCAPRRVMEAVTPVLNAVGMHVTRASMELHESDMIASVLVSAPSGSTISSDTFRKARDDIATTLGDEAAVLVEGAHFDRGPLGEIIHDPETLLAPLQSEQAFVFCFMLQTLPPWLLTAFFDVTRDESLDVVALYVDERNSAAVYGTLQLQAGAKKSQATRHIAILQERFENLLRETMADGQVTISAVLRNEDDGPALRRTMTEVAPRPSEAEAQVADEQVLPNEVPENTA
jgi:hypothetical protein